MNGREGGKRSNLGDLQTAMVFLPRAAPTNMASPDDAFEFIDESERRTVVRAFQMRIAGHAILASLSVWTTTMLVPALAASANAYDHIERLGMARLFGVGVLLYLGSVLAGWAVHMIFKEVPT